jgi:hypothetical protein
MSLRFVALSSAAAVLPVRLTVSRLEAENQPENRRSCDRIFRWPPPDGIVAEDGLFKLRTRR